MTEESTQRIKDEVGRKSNTAADGERQMSSSNGARYRGRTGEKESDRQKRGRHASEDSAVSLDSMEEYIPTPPDGGWGWVIVASSLICNLIVDGIGYSFGVFLGEFAEAFQEPKSKVSLVGSLLCGTYLFAGPIVSGLTNKFGCRAVIIAGSCIATVAFFLASFSPGLDMLIITYGVIGGFGLGMVYLPAIVSVGYYFEKKRAFATGIAVCGSGIGTFLFPPLSEFLLMEFSWRGGLLIIAAITFHGCICGCFMRPLEAKPKPKTDKRPRPRAKNLLDRLKETAHHRDRSISECSGVAHGVGDSSRILERLMEAKLQREKHLQDNDSDLGSLPSIAFVKKMDSVGSGDHRHISGSIAIPDDGRRHKLSISSNADSVNSPARDIAAASPSHQGLRSLPPTPRITADDDREYIRSDQKDGQISPDPDSDAKMSQFGVNADDETSTIPSDYYTPPLSPVTTNENTPFKEPASQINGKVVTDSDTKQDTSEASDNKLPNGLSYISGNEIIPLLEVPAPVIRPGGNRVGSYGGSRTNITNLQSLRSLHISKKDLARPLYRKDIFYSGSVLNIPQYQSQPDMKSYITSITTIPGEMEFVDGPSPSSKCINKCCSCLPRSVRDVLSEMADISLLKDISFMLICVGNIMAFLGFYIPFMFLVELAISLDIDKSQAAFLISIIGITNTVGRVLIGKLADLRIVDSLVITYISIALCGVMTLLIPYCTTYPLLAANAAVFGLGMAAFISLSSIVICDRMGLEKLTNAFGLLSMMRGLAGMVGPPFAGYMYDSSGAYDLSFYIGGFLLLAGAVCHCLLHLPCLRPKVEEDTVMEEVTGEEILQILGSKPHLVTIEEAYSAT